MKNSLLITLVALILISCSHSRIIEEPVKVEPTATIAQEIDLSNLTSHSPTHNNFHLPATVHFRQAGVYHGQSYGGHYLGTDILPKEGAIRQFEERRSEPLPSLRVLQTRQELEDDYNTRRLEADMGWGRELVTKRRQSTSSE